MRPQLTDLISDTELIRRQLANGPHCWPYYPAVRRGSLHWLPLDAISRAEAAEFIRALQLAASDHIARESASGSLRSAGSGASFLRKPPHPSPSAPDQQKDMTTKERTR